MKRIISLIMCAVLALLCYGCSGSTSTEETEPATTEPIVVPEIAMVVNEGKDDTTTDMRIFPTYKERSGAYVHFFIKSDKAEETIRIKKETRWGTDEKATREFEVKSDSLQTVKTNTWESTAISTTASNLYFHRITIYYGETEEMMATATIYTPYEKAAYTESDFSDTPPEFHHISNLTDTEQVFYNNCEYAVVDHAKAIGYERVNNMFGFEANDSLYLYVEYQKSGKGYKTYWFNIDKNDLTNYKTNTKSDGIIPDDDNVSKNYVLDEYFYVSTALSNAISG